MRKWSKITKEQLYDLYIVQNLTRTEIKKLLGIPPTSCQRLLDKYGLKKSSKQMKEMFSRVNHQINQNLSPEKQESRREKCRMLAIQQDKVTALKKVNRQRSSEHQQKLTEACKKHYRNETTEQREARINHIREKTKLAMSRMSEEKKIRMVFNRGQSLKNRTPEQKAITKVKRSLTMTNKSPEQKEKIQEKQYETKKKNKSFNISKPENQIYKKLKEKYPNTQRQYKSIVYPFSCDFYIPELNLYIEYQGHWTHGKHPYDKNNLEDVKIIEMWEKKHKPFYDLAVKIWSIKDPIKRQIAKENKINWIEFFDMDSFEQWLNLQSN